MSAAAAVLLGLSLFAQSPLGTAPGPLKPIAAPAAAPSASGGQETTIDLSAVPSAPEYRTDEPQGPRFLGSDAAVLGRSLARINKVLGTSLRPDSRLSVLARWIYERLGPDRSMPPQSAFDLLVSRLGLPEPLPHFLVTEARDAPRLANVVSSRLATLFDLADYTHIGGVAEREAHGVVVVIVLSRRHIEIAPVARSLSAPGRIELKGRLLGAYAKPELAHTLPGGKTRFEELGRGPDFLATVDLAETGRHRLEIVADGPGGPGIIANFPVFVGVPVDESVEAAAAAPTKRAVRPDDARQRLFELINAERVKAGLDALTFDPELAAVALKHSEDMRTNDFVSHVSPTTGTSEERLLEAGIITDRASENVGKGYTPDEIHQGFMDSPGHRAAILLPDVTHVGIGVVSKKEFDRTTYLVTEIFIRRIPPLGPDARGVFLSALNDWRRKEGTPALREDSTFTRIADETAREFMENQLFTEDEVMGRLRQHLARIDPAISPPVRSILAVLRVVGSLEEGAEQAASDPKTSRAQSVGIGIAQGTRPGLVPNAIVVVLIFVD
ncbi:MAG: CAP domain-containing protein [Candidatus Aminicenantales bacterium]